MFRPHHGVTTLVVLLATACQPGTEETAEPARAVSRGPGAVAAIGDRETVGSTAAEPATPAVDAREVTLDARGAVRLVGTLEPVPPDSDADRVLVLEVRGAALDAALASELDGARVLDARFVDDGVVTVGVDHVLRLHAHGDDVELDERVEPPLSVVGGAIAYARGFPPNLEIARTDIASRTTAAITHDMNPAWSPALTPDGTAIVFVSGIEGTARFYRAERGVIRPLPPTDRTPSAPVAPRFEGELLHFVDHLGDAWLDPERGQIVRTIAGPVAPSSATEEAR